MMLLVTRMILITLVCVGCGTVCMMSGEWFWGAYYMICLGISVYSEIQVAIKTDPRYIEYQKLNKETSC